MRKFQAFIKVLHEQLQSTITGNSVSITKNTNINYCQDHIQTAMYK